MVRLFSFFPPKPPSYDIITVNGEPKLFLNKQIETPIELPWLSISVMFIQTEAKETIPIVYYSHKSAHYTVIFSHGNSADIGMMKNYLIEFATHLNVSVILYEYSGYGQSTGKPSETNLKADIRAVYNHAILHLEIPWNRIVLYGHSIGTGPTCDLASEFPVGGVVLHSPLASGLRIFSKTLKKSSKYDLFNNLEKAPYIRCPVFIIHGTLDKEVPIRHGQWLFAKLHMPYQPYWVDGAGHNNIEILYRQEFFNRLRNFITDLAEFHSSENSESYKHLMPFDSSLKPDEIPKNYRWPIYVCINDNTTENADKA